METSPLQKLAETRRPPGLGRVNIQAARTGPTSVRAPPARSAWPGPAWRGAARIFRGRPTLGSRARGQRTGTAPGKAGAAGAARRTGRRQGRGHEHGVAEHDQHVEHGVEGGRTWREQVRALAGRVLLAVVGCLPVGVN